MVGLVGLLCACSNNDTTATLPEDSNVMTFEMLHPSQVSFSKTMSRANDTGFDKGDNVGVYITTHDVPLQLAGNYANNEQINFDGSTWTPARTIYWDNGKYDIFAYYPYISNVTSVDDLPFSVATDQTTTKTGNTLGGYEASDFLYASNTDVAASNSAVKLQYKHKMSKILVRLVKGEDYEGDLPDVAEVYIHNTVPSATIDLSAGVVTRYQYGATKTIRAKSLGNNLYAAIIVPQRISNRQPLIEVIAKGVSYLWESNFLFKPGVQHTVSLVIDKNPEQVKIDVGGEIENWQ
jgi:hypothetical protein